MIYYSNFINMMQPCAYLHKLLLNKQCLVNVPLNFFSMPSVMVKALSVIFWKSYSYKDGRNTMPDLRSGKEQLLWYTSTSCYPVDSVPTGNVFIAISRVSKYIISSAEITARSCTSESWRSFLDWIQSSGIMTGTSWAFPLLLWYATLQLSTFLLQAMHHQCH